MSRSEPQGYVTSTREWEKKKFSKPVVILRNFSHKIIPQLYNSIKNPAEFSLYRDKN